MLSQTSLFEHKKTLSVHHVGEGRSGGWGLVGKLLKNRRWKALWVGQWGVEWFKFHNEDLLYDSRSLCGSLQTSYNWNDFLFCGCVESWKLEEGVESVSTSLLLGKEQQHQEVWSGKGETEDQAGPGQWWLSAAHWCFRCGSRRERSVNTGGRKAGKKQPRKAKKKKEKRSKRQRGCFPQFKKLSANIKVFSVIHTGAGAAAGPHDNRSDQRSLRASLELVCFPNIAALQGDTIHISISPVRPGVSL